MSRVFEAKESFTGHCQTNELVNFRLSLSYVQSQLETPSLYVVVLRLNVRDSLGQCSHISYSLFEFHVHSGVVASSHKLWLDRKTTFFWTSGEREHAAKRRRLELMETTLLLLLLLLPLAS